MVFHGQAANGARRSHILRQGQTPGARGGGRGGGRGGDGDSVADTDGSLSMAL